MPLPKIIRQEIEPMVADYCAKRVPDHACRQVKMGYSIRANSMTLIEERPHWQKPDLWIKTPIAQFRYDPKNGAWTLYCADRNSRWHDYQIKPERDIRILLQEVDADPTHVFWG